MDSEKILPVIDLGLAKGPTRSTLVKQLRDALTTVGFIYLTGVEGFDEVELLRLTKWFFSLPMEKRMAISKKSFNPQSAHEYRGFFPVIPGAVSHKEAFEIGPRKEEGTKMPQDSIAAKIFCEDNQWPEEDTEMGRHFRAWMENYHYIMTETSLEILRLIAEGFGAPSDFYTSIFSPTNTSLSTLRLIHYPARPNPPESARDGDYVIQTAEHHDSTMVTLLATFPEYPGLQVRWWQDNSIIDVPHKPGHLVMNIGDLLSHTTGGKLKATKHRVVDTCGDRLSVPFFMEPRFDANVNVALPGETLQDTTTRNYGPWLFEKISKWAEYEDLIRRLSEMEKSETKDGQSM
uniref:Fe2OG dioxygenase domain-containing protein n=1 Tax=Scylla olivacea TaxID=85551 RepID=A0A0P4WFE3_SCYOL